jgi:hypothetical protein
MILLRSLPADCADGIGYVSRTVIFDGVYPERTRCSAVEEPMVPPPPTMITRVFALEGAIFSSLDLTHFRSCKGRYQVVSQRVRQ